MPTLRRLIPLLAALPLACTTSPGTTSDASTDSTEAHASHEGSTHATDHEDTHATHDSHEPTSSTGHEHASSTGHEHASSTGHEHASSTGHDTHGETSATTGELTPIDAYCACMLEKCHDQYHATWGEDHEASEAMCAAAAAAVPSVGMPATMGNSLECRQHHCDLGEDEPGACDSALGGGACI